MKTNSRLFVTAMLMLIGTNSIAQNHNHDNHDNKKEHTMMNHDEMKTSHNAVLEHYLELKNALVSDDNSKASKAGRMLVMAFNNYDISNHENEVKKELEEIIEVASEHAEHIAKSDISHQREHFKQLSLDMIDFVELTDLKTELFVQYCPMYDKGSSWLSSSSDIKNPFYGSKMLTCGKVEKKIN